MKQLRFSTIFIVIFSISVLSVSAQKVDKFWQEVAVSEIDASVKMERRNTPNQYEILNLDIDLLKQALQVAPKRSSAKSQKSNVIVNFPNEQGELEPFEVFEASILEAELQEKFPNIKSYVGTSVKNPETAIRFSLSTIGLHAMIMQSKQGTIYIDPYTTNKKSYIIYSKKSVSKADFFECNVVENNVVSKETLSNLSSKTNNANDGKLRKYRLAVATTGEYSQFQLLYNGVSLNATYAQRIETVLSAINATMTRVNAIFERDVSLTMTLVANNASIIFFDPLNDGFTNNDGSILINESQTVIDANIGFDNYDIGHTFSTGGGGLATLNSPCTGSKAKGITGSSYPTGDAYDIDFVAHEMGHQYGANHTFNSEEGSCDGGNINNGTAVEPGSGSTIMSYAGLCAPENVQPNSDDYFHLVSIKEMWSNITLGNSSSCAQITTTGNTAPVVNDLIAYTLPISTPFVLTATANDVNSADILTYTWEQLDTEIAIAPPIASAANGPAFRSVAPSISSQRYFPNQSTVISGATSNTWEVLPSVARTMKFGVTVRDNNVNGGQTASKETTLTFSASSGPFKVTSQSASVSWNSADTKTITWNVANTNSAPVNCANVNILLSIDGGYTFPYTLKSNVPNNGTASVVVPNVTSTIGRIKVESVGNIFYAINDADITIQAKEFTMSFANTELKACKSVNAVYNFTYQTFLGFNEVTTFSATGNPAGTTVSFNPTSTATNATAVQVTVSGLSSLNPGSYEFTVSGTSATTAMVKNQVLTLNVYDASILAPTLTTPLNNAEAFAKPYSLNWDVDINAESYEIEIASDENFTTIIEQATVITNTFSPQLLLVNTKYYWRVRGLNDCGTGVYSTVFNFTTANEVCNIYNATDIPKTLPTSGLNTVTSILNIADNKIITNVKVRVNITHTWISDLTLELIGPTGVSVLLSVENGGDGDNYTNTVFDDLATTNISNGSPPFTGNFKPQIPLSYFNNTESKGNWTLKIVDAEDGDGGVLNNWSLEICGISMVSNDDDNDGVTNDIDQCPNTASGNTVNSVGCFIFPANNFTIEAVGETCLDKDNGKIIISVLKNYNYTTTVNGTAYNFSSSLIISNLASGTYNFCISVFVADENKNYEQCFSAVINEGGSIAGKAVVANQKVEITISQGTPPFYAYVNNELILTTFDTNFEINAYQGDLVQVKTNVECEGVLSKEVDFTTEMIAYPNPTKGLFEIALPIKQKEVVVEMYSIQGQLISKEKYPLITGKVQVSLEGKPTGVYIAKVILDQPVTFKIIKE
jgi:subtilisin-like proprotein convertase family protein